MSGVPPEADRWPRIGQFDKKSKFYNVGSASAPTLNGGHGGPPYISGRNELSYKVSGVSGQRILNFEH